MMEEAPLSSSRGGDEASLDADNIILLKEQFGMAQESIKYLQTEHAQMLKGLHEEIERLHNLCRDLQFRCESGSPLQSNGEFFKCSPLVLEQKVNTLIQENSDLRRKLAESHQAIDILDQKEKLALWQHHQELEQRDNAILRLEKELEFKCGTITQLASSQGARRKKGNFWRRFSFASSNHPSTSAVSKVQPRPVEHFSREDLPSEIQNSLQSHESQYQSYSSYSSLSDDEGFFPQRCEGECKSATIKLPPISHLPLVSTRQMVRQQLRINGLANQVTADSLAIDRIQPTELSVKRLA